MTTLSAMSIALFSFIALGLILSTFHKASKISARTPAEDPRLAWERKRQEAELLAREKAEDVFEAEMSTWYAANGRLES